VITGRVIRIIDKKRVILNVGSAAGVRQGMSFGIYTPVEPIQDPVTGVDLGRYRRLKATVEVDEVEERFSVASPPTRYQPMQLNVLGGQTTWPDLPVEAADIEPLVSGEKVRVGDEVETADDEADDADDE
jgi:hypothetical protein